jgi:hypothetical protein
MNALSLLAIFHPVPVTLLAVALIFWVLRRPTFHGFRIYITLGISVAFIIYFSIDSIFTSHRAIYAANIPDHPVIYSTLSLPPSLKLVGIDCDNTCLTRLVDGSLEEVVTIWDGDSSIEPIPTVQARRYSIQRATPDNCPADPRRRAERMWTTPSVKALWSNGICPTIEDVSIPTEGIFVVRAGRSLPAGQPARQIRSRYLINNPPGFAISFYGVEVQRRSVSGTEIIAQTYYYEAPGYLGLPPLIGCWVRPDNVIWIMPSGDTGCGFWRRTVHGGDWKYASSSADWVYRMVFPKAN